MTYLEVKCCKCGEKIIVTEKTFDVTEQLICPKCGSNFPKRFNEDAIHALGLISDINRESDKDHREIGTDDFRVSIKFNQD